MTSFLRKLMLWKAAFGHEAKIPLDPLQAARDSLLNKSTRLDLADRAVMTKHLADIAHDEIDAARRMKARSGLAAPVSDKASEDVGDIIVCDDYHRGEPVAPAPPEPSRAWPMAAGIALAGALIGGMVSLPAWLDRMKTPPAVPPAQPATQPPAPNPGGTTTTIKKGFIIDLPGAK